MRFLLGILFLMGIVSCSNDDNDNMSVDNNVAINGTWKPYKYEFRGKTIMVSDCELQGLININTDFSGAYERYEISPTSGNCNKADSFTGKWSFDKLYNTLTLTYTESGVDKTLKKSVQSYSATELKISDNSKNLDTTPGNDEAILVFIKE